MSTQFNNITDGDVASFDAQLEMQGRQNSMDSYQQLATKTAIYPGVGTPLGLMYVTIKGSGEVGEFSEKVGKAFRDDNLLELQGSSTYGNPEKQVLRLGVNELSDEKRQALLLELGDELWYLSAKCNELQVNLSEVALMNLQKLNSRSKRGKLSGSGDNR